MERTRRTSKSKADTERIVSGPAAFWQFHATPPPLSLFLSLQFRRVSAWLRLSLTSPLAVADVTSRKLRVQGSDCRPTVVRWEFSRRVYVVGENEIFAGKTRRPEVGERRRPAHRSRWWGGRRNERSRRRWTSWRQPNTEDLTSGGPCTRTARRCACRAQFEVWIVDHSFHADRPGQMMHATYQQSVTEPRSRCDCESRGWLHQHHHHLPPPAAVAIQHPSTVDSRVDLWLVFQHATTMTAKRFRW